MLTEDLREIRTSVMRAYNSIFFRYEGLTFSDARIAEKPMISVFVR